MDPTILGAIISATIGAIGTIIGTVIAALIMVRAQRPPPTPTPAPPWAQPGESGTTGPTNPSTIPPPAAPLKAAPGAGCGTIFVTALTMFLFFTGFAMFLYVVVSFITAIFVALQNQTTPDISAIPFVPLLPLGLGLAFAGLVVAVVGAAAGFLIWRRKGSRS
jgi:Ca2+/Na+ antiporter